MHNDEFSTDSCYVFDGHSCKDIVRVMKRLASLDRMTGDAMSDYAAMLDSALRHSWLYEDE